MSEYWNKFPVNAPFAVDFTEEHGGGYLEVHPQKGPQTAFIACSGGISGQELRDQDFPLIFYGGAK